MKGFYKVTVRSLRTGLEFWTIVEARDRGDAEMKAYHIVKMKKGGWWPSADLCKMQGTFLGTKPPEMTESGELVEVPAPDPGSGG